MQKLQISIPEPCHENWQNMTPSDQGRFCNACAKTVVDFSMMSDHEVLSYFSTVSDEKVCGRALPTQLNRNMTMPREPKKRWFWYWNYVAMFFMLFSKSNNAKAQGEIRPITQTVKKPTCNVTMGTMVAPQLKTERVVSGKVTSNSGSPASFATVMNKSTKTGVSTDINGNYSIKAKTGDLLEFSFVGFEILDKTIDNNTNTFDAVLRQTRSGEMVITAGLMIRRIDKKCTNSQVDQAANIKVLDKQTMLPLDGASLVINNAKSKRSDTTFTGRNGIHVFEKIKDGELYTVKAFATGYETASVTIKGSATESKTIVKEILLEKKIDIVAGRSNFINSGTGQKVTLGGVHRVINTNHPLLVVDEVMLPLNYIGTMNPNDVLNVSVMKPAAAIALYGQDGENGAIIVITKKKNQNDSLRVVKAIVKKVTDKIGITSSANPINLYPNPVRSGSSFVVDLSLQRVGEMEIQITDINGRVVLQKQITTSSKDHLEKIETDERWPAGMYFLNVFNSNGGQQGKLFNAVSFVVQ